MTARDGKKALIIGGGGDGIGRAITRGFGAAGAAAAVADVDRERAAEAAAEIAESGALAHALTGDVRSLEEVAGLVARAAQALGGLDVLVTVVGGQVAFVPAARLHEMPRSPMQRCSSPLRSRRTSPARAS